MNLLEVIVYSGMVVGILGGITVYCVYNYIYWFIKKVPVLHTNFISKMTIDDDTRARVATGNYEKMKEEGHKFCGLVNALKRAMVLIDLDIIEEIMTDWWQEHFIYRGFHFGDVYVSPAYEEPPPLDGKDWEDMKARLIPDINGREMETLMPSILTVSNRMIEALEEYTVHRKDIDVKKFLNNFTIDLVSLHSFKIDSDSFKHSKESFWLSTWSGWEKTEENLSRYVYSIVRRGIESRQKCKFSMYCTDLLLYLKKNHNTPEREHSMLDILRVALFFHHSFDVACSTLRFAIYELCRNPKIQKRARTEIQQVLVKYNGLITAESLNEMKYLQLIVDETLRMYPPVPNIIRRCVADYKLETENFTITKGTRIIVPVFALHRDPQYCPDANTFDPERFCKESKHFRPPSLYMPYGVGPMELKSIHASLLQCKIGLIRTLCKFRLSLSQKTKVPLQLDPEVYMQTVDRLYIKTERL
ncbi:hypothetical protein NQ318_001958 [Aromia moschata]|uniref:Cytochrome P450 n=1 Tax=Aromia moschata TaxID=1265417 RepID=A0AAV8Z477_9CUCU|nr:hypothetical protein NQ318_001958 [Aromia moschata]